MASIRKIKNRKKETYELDYRDPLTGVRKRKMLYCDKKTASAILKETEARLSRREFGIDTKLDRHTAWKDLEKRYQIHSSKVKSVKTTKRENLCATQLICSCPKLILKTEVCTVVFSSHRKFLY